MKKNTLHLDYYFIGIGGAGMSALAKACVQLGFSVGGSDIKDIKQSSVLKNLNKIGCKIYTEQNGLGVSENNINQIIISSAIQTSNIDLITAQKKNIIILHRADLLAQISNNFNQSIAVTGAHGKTSTTGLLGEVFKKFDFKYLMINGGEYLNSSNNIINLNTNNQHFKYCIMEADESDASFLKLSPKHAIITNIDSDHMSTYGHSDDKLDFSFLHFAQNISGILILNADCQRSMGLKNILENKGHRSEQIISIGFSSASDIQIKNKNIDLNLEGMEFELDFKLNNFNLNSNLKIKTDQMGDYIIYNISMAVSLVFVLNKMEIINNHLTLNQSNLIKRRANSYKLENFLNRENIVWIDDYAHHPTELKAVFEASILRFSNRRKIIVFEPHRYTRTRDLKEKFIDFFEDSLNRYKNLELILMPVYSAGEAYIKNSDGIDLFHAIQNNKSRVHFAKNCADLQKKLASLLMSEDCVMTLGAGTIGEFARKIFKGC